jgi:hypothetical protein
MAFWLAWFTTSVDGDCVVIVADPATTEPPVGFAEAAMGASVDASVPIVSETLANSLWRYLDMSGAPSEGG